MSTRIKRLAACVGVAALAVLARASQATPLSVSVGNVNVQATAIAPTVFRISVNTAGPAGPIASIYLGEKPSDSDVGMLGRSAGHLQLTTVMGTLDVDPANGVYSLLDAHGTVLIPPASLMPTSGGSALGLNIGWPAGKPFAVYGSGNATGSLVQHAVAAHVDNGIAVEPFFWSPAGYAAFVVGGDADKPAQCDGTVSSGAVTWQVAGSAADLYLMIAPHVGDASASLLALTGKPPVPPLWAFGYLQSRWGWQNSAYVNEVQSQFASRKLPVDAFIFDFEWYTTYPDYDVKPAGVSDFVDFGWNPNVFPDPAEQLQKLHAGGVHFVGIRKPRLGNAGSLAMVRSKGWDFRGGTSYDARDLRFDIPALRDWYAGQTQLLLKDPVDGWWDDEGEYTYTTYTCWNMAERQALDGVRPHQRLWSICRAFDPGTSRMGAAAWTGDILANWQSLQRTPTDLLNWTLAGMPYCGCDIGGFHGETNPELLVRWMQAGTFFPVMRTHSELTVRPHFPWLFGDQAEAAIRKTLDLRYQLIPMLYSLAHGTYETGQPLARPLLMQYPSDPAVANLSSEWLVGNDLLVAPVLEPGGHRSIYLPDDTWYDFASGQKVAGGRSFDQTVPFDAVPVYVRGGAILPLAPLVLHTSDLPGGPLNLQVYPGRDGQFTLVEDDGISTAYTNGNVRRTTFTWDDAGKKLSWTRSGPYDGDNCFRTMRVSVVGTATEAAEQPLSESGQVQVGG
jgi:alpha-glucosidase